jgi:rod shape determining protein RodA
MMLENRKKLDIDWIIIVDILLLMIYGTLMLANATGKPQVPEGSGWLQYAAAMNKYFIVRHALFFALGVVAAAVVIYLDYRIFGQLWWVIYGFVIAMLIGVLLFGTEVYGQKRWDIGPIEVQPSEIAKISLIIMLAWEFAGKENGIQNLRDLAVVALKVSAPLVLILMQPDLGTALVYIFVAAVMIFASGTRYSILGLLGALAAAAVPIAWSIPDLLSDTQKNRILSFLDPNMDPTGAGYNVLHSKTAVGSGQVFGKGFFKPNALSQTNYIPVQESDFIFAATGETVGFVGTLIVVLLFAVLILRMIIISSRIYDKFGSYLVIGVAAMMFIHIFENIGMCIGIMPVTGIPLPFFSYGGSSMLTNMIGVGIVECVYLRRRRGSVSRSRFL